ncbi:MAG TPA: septum formation initiator family protein [Solirubrobacterales bacterium]|nr:septum formation initiator family protein [Solirubrobacterales bacterium]
MRWDRLGRIALTVVLFAIVFSYFNPAINLVDAYRASNQTEANLAQLQAENARLEEKAESINEDSVLIREARRQGMVLPGERPYVVHGLGG